MLVPCVVVPVGQLLHYSPHKVSDWIGSLEEARSPPPKCVYPASCEQSSSNPMQCHQQTPWTCLGPGLALWLRALFKQVNAYPVFPCHVPVLTCFCPAMNPDQLMIIPAALPCSPLNPPLRPHPLLSLLSSPIPPFPA